MELKRGSVVRSKAGRDRGFLAVLEYTERYALLADGRDRPLERPKRKNIRHLAATAHILSEDELATNRSLRRALTKYAEPGGGD